MPRSLVPESEVPWCELRILRPEKFLPRENRRGERVTPTVLWFNLAKEGEILYGTPGAAFFQAEIPLEKPTQVEIYTEAPLAYPHAIQKGSKTLTLIPGKHILGEGVVIELNGLIVNILNPSPKEGLKRGVEVVIKAEVRML